MSWLAETTTYMPFKLPIQDEKITPLPNSDIPKIQDILWRQVSWQLYRNELANREHVFSNFSIKSNEITCSLFANASRNNCHDDCLHSNSCILGIQEFGRGVIFSSPIGSLNGIYVIVSAGHDMSCPSDANSLSFP